jgi:hypothetical protein
MKAKDLLNPNTSKIVDKMVVNHLKVFGMEHLKPENIEKEKLNKIDRHDNLARINRLNAYIR